MTDKEAIEFAEKLQHFCRSHERCKDCPFVSETWYKTHCHIYRPFDYELENVKNKMSKIEDDGTEDINSKNTYTKNYHKHYNNNSEYPESEDNYYDCEADSTWYGEESCW